MEDIKNIKSSELENCMSVLGFSDLERKIYLTLLRGGTMSAYQIAKKIEVSRPSIYNTLEHMVNKGMAEVIPNDTALYAVQKPEILLRKLRTDFNRSADTAEMLLKNYAPPEYGEQYANLKGFEIILQRVREIMRNSRSEIYINTDMSLEIISDEFNELAQRSIRAVVYSFYNVGCEDICELYSHNRPIDRHQPSRIMIVSDGEIALTAGPDSEGVWQGTVTSNRLFVKIISEHIHNDIYLLKLRDRFGKEIYDDLHIYSKYENRNRQ